MKINRTTFNDKQWKEIVLGLRHGLSIKQVLTYAQADFSAEQMYQIRNAYEDGLREEQVLIFANPQHSVYRMRILCQAIKSGAQTWELNRLLLADESMQLGMMYNRMRMGRRYA